MDSTGQKNTDISTLSGFPGDFTTDWELFVQTFFNKPGNQLEAAEHEVMATKYHTLLVSGLKEFGDPNFTNSDYEAIAWIGLDGTDYYNQILNDGDTEFTESQINSAKNKANEECN